jgi:hypothetical protein
LIYKRTKNIRAIQLLLGHTKLESTVHYLGIEVDDALEISEQMAYEEAARSSWFGYWLALPGRLDLRLPP